MIDPRFTAVERRLAAVKRILPVTGGKGGIGKSLVASMLALALAREGKRVGLLDLDLTGPCDHLILGIGGGFPTEEFGIEPPCFDGIRFMSVSFFAGASPAPLRGSDVSNALLEILAITRWEELDALVIDMPPGLGDVALDTMRLIPRAEYVVLTTASHIVLETVRRTLTLLDELGAGIAGLLENMQREASSAVADLSAEFGLPHLGALPYDEAIEQAAGHPARLETTEAFRALRPILRRLFDEA